MRAHKVPQLALRRRQDEPVSVNASITLLSPGLPSPLLDPPPSIALPPFAPPPSIPLPYPPLSPSPPIVQHTSADGRPAQARNTLSGNSMAAIILGVLVMAVVIVFYALIWPRIKQKMMRYFTPREVLTQRDALQQQRAYIERPCCRSR